tara:strand:- start:106 stop:735 length:630 start_codon:yes stop_codon:yes gene_type:complete
MLHGLPAAYEAATEEGDGMEVLPAHYELLVCVPDGEAELKAIYDEKADAHNLPVLRYLAGDVDAACDAGFDLYVPDTTVVPQGYGARTASLLDHKVKCCMRFYEEGAPGGRGRLVGYYLYPRSSMGARTPFRLANSVGIIDAGYRGPIKAALDLVPTCQVSHLAERHARLVQLCPPDLTYPMAVRITSSEADLGGATARGSGGFGSTGE